MLQFIQTLPAIITLLLEIIKWIKSAAEGDPAKKLMEITDAIALVRNADSQESRRNAARAIARAINRM